MEFDWMQPYQPPARTRDRLDRGEMYRREIAERAAVFYRLGYTLEHAVGRLQANADWDFETGAPRPRELDAAAIAAIVQATYGRRPAR